MKYELWIKFSLRPLHETPRTLRLIKHSNKSIPQIFPENTHQLISSPAHQLANSPVRQLTNSSAHQLISSSAHQLSSLPPPGSASASSFSSAC
jgi:hypothetical protein